MKAGFNRELIKQVFATARDISQAGKRGCCGRNACKNCEASQRQPANKLNGHQPIATDGGRGLETVGAIVFQAAQPMN